MDGFAQGSREAAYISGESTLITNRSARRDNNRARRALPWVGLVWGLLALLVAACSRPQFPNPLSAPTSTPTPTPFPTPTPVPVPAEDAQTPTPTPITLIWWTPRWFSPEGEDPAARFIAEQIARFEEQYPTVRVHTLVKRTRGKGSVRDYLEGAYKVAPALLPDVVTVNMEDIPTLSGLGIFQPLSALLPPEAVDGLYPVARTAGMWGDEWLAVQFEADFYHVVYWQERWAAPPATWDAVLNSEMRYLPLLFSPEVEGEVADPVLLQYAAAGGALPTTELVPLNEAALLSLFNFYDQAMRRGVITTTVASLADPDTLWEALLKQQADMVDIAARRYVQDGLARGELAVASLPTWDGKGRALVRGWGLAITTGIAERQQAAALFVAWLLRPEVLGPWSQYAARVPLHPDALQAWNAPAPYVQMTDALLRNAQPYPRHAALTALRRALAVGLKALLNEGVTPEEAVERTREAYTPPQY